MIRRILTILLLAFSLLSASAAGPYGDLITLTDGSMIYGYISKDDLTNGNIEIDTYWIITSAAAKDVEIIREDVRNFRLDDTIKNWLDTWREEVPEICTLANISMTGKYCDSEYLICDQVLSDDIESLDKLLLEDGDVIKYVDFTPRRLKLDWKKVERIDRNNYDIQMEDEIIDTSGKSTKGLIESQVLRHHRVILTPEGKRFTFQPQRISVLKKRSTGSKSPLEESPLIESLILEENAGGAQLDGVIVENNREKKYFIILMPGEETRQVTYADVKAIAYRPNN